MHGGRLPVTGTRILRATHCEVWVWQGMSQVERQLCPGEGGHRHFALHGAWCALILRVCVVVLVLLEMWREQLSPTDDQIIVWTSGYFQGVASCLLIACINF